MSCSNNINHNFLSLLPFHAITFSSCISLAIQSLYILSIEHTHMWFHSHWYSIYFSLSVLVCYPYFLSKPSQSGFNLFLYFSWHIQFSFPSNKVGKSLLLYTNISSSFSKHSFLITHYLLPAFVCLKISPFTFLF